MTNIVQLKPKRNVVQQFTCPDCNGIGWQVLVTHMVIEGSELHHTDFYCATDGCDFVAPAILILPDGDDEE